MQLRVVDICLVPEQKYMLPVLKEELSSIIFSSCEIVQKYIQMYPSQRNLGLMPAQVVSFF